MRYVTTRSKEKTFSPLHALNDQRAEDGGFYIPAVMPAFSPEEIDAFAMKNPNQAIAEILNLLFGCDLNRWDVDFAAGRYPVRISTMNHRIVVAESWHNAQWDFSAMVQGLTARIRESRDMDTPPGEWSWIAVRIGVLFGIFGELMREGIASRSHPVDFAVPSGDFTAVMAAWYARSWGLPVRNIIICCNENNNLWDLVYHGQMRTSTALQTTETPDCDHVVAPSLERLIHACGGEGDVERFLRNCDEGRAFFPEELALEKLQKGLHAVVVSRKRMESTIPNAYSTHSYVFGPYSALTYAGLLDYRARTGESGYGLILSERGALCDDGYVARAMNVTVSKLHKILD